VPKYAAFLRGINVSNRRAKSADLCSPLEGLGFEDVETFRASGNVVFAASREPMAKLTARMEKALEASLGYDVAVFLRSAKEVRDIAGHEPFPAKWVEASEGKLQISMLLRLPPAKQRGAVLALATDEDRLAFGARELYWLPRGGMSESELDLKEIDRLVGVATRRTMGTIEQMATRYFDFAD
jgi:uncharacterized protein (DUF1697 family)